MINAARVDQTKSKLTPFSCRLTQTIQKSLFFVAALVIVGSALLVKATSHGNNQEQDTADSQIALRSKSAAASSLTRRSWGDEESLLSATKASDLDTAAGHEKKYILVKKKPKHKKIKSEIYEPKMKYKKVVMKVPVKVMKKKKIKGYLVKKHHDHHEHYWKAARDQQKSTNERTLLIDLFLADKSD